MPCFIFSLLWLPVAQLSHLLLVLAPLAVGPGGKFATHPPFPSSHLRLPALVQLGGHCCVLCVPPKLCSPIDWWALER